MTLRMPQPWRHPNGTYYLRERVPADLKKVASGRTVVLEFDGRSTPVVIGDHVKVSLRTKDSAPAKERYRAASASLDRVWSSLRAGPRKLTHKEVTALVGDAYALLSGAFDNDPGASEEWARIEAANLLAENDSSPEALERSFGGWADIILRKRGLVVDEDSRARLLKALPGALRQAYLLNMRRADGDYSPDPDAARFPKWVDALPASEAPSATKATSGATKVSLTGLVEDWWVEAKAIGRKPSTHESYRNSMASLVAFLKHDEAGRVTPDDVIAFKDHRLAAINPRTRKPVSPKTVKDSDLAGLKTVFGWAVANRRMASNPAKDVTLKLGKAPKLRSKGFTEAEAKAILVAALKQGRMPGSTKATLAKRWVPWLSAYTGARVGELAQLRREDVAKEGEVWTITITPEAGTVKTNEARKVPLHPHLVELGFPVFVSSSKAGHLFLKPNPKTGDVLGPLQGLKNRLAEFARSVVTDPNVAPTHGWRHRFKTVGMEAGIDGRVLDAIQGQAPRTVADTYGEVTVKTMVAAIAKLPRIEAR